MNNNSVNISRRKLLATTAMSGTAVTAGCTSSPPEKQPKPFRYEPSYPAVGEDITFIAPTFSGEKADIDWNIKEDDSISKLNQTRVVHQFDSAGKKVVEMSVKVERSPGDIYTYSTSQIIPVNKKESQSLNLTTDDISISLRSRTNIVKTEPRNKKLIDFAISNDISSKKDVITQLTIQTPSGISVTGTKSVDSAEGGLFTTSITAAPGEAEGIGININPISPGEYEIQAKVTYYVSGESEDATIETLSFPLNVISSGSRNQEWIRIDDSGSMEAIETGFKLIFIGGPILFTILYTIYDNYTDPY